APQPCAGCEGWPPRGDRRGGKRREPVARLKTNVSFPRKRESSSHRRELISGGVNYWIVRSSRAMTITGIKGVKLNGGDREASARGLRRHRLRAGPSCAQACGPCGWPRPSRGHASPRASRNSSEASSRGRCLRAAFSSSAPGGPDRHCYRERRLARSFSLRLAE